MKARWFHVLLVVMGITGVLIAGLVARSEASSALAQVDASHHAAPSAFSIPF
jgi:hypothetical protein